MSSSDVGPRGMPLSRFVKQRLKVVDAETGNVRQVRLVAAKLEDGERETVYLSQGGRRLVYSHDYETLTEAR